MLADLSPKPFPVGVGADPAADVFGFDVLAVSELTGKLNNDGLENPPGVGVGFVDPDAPRVKGDAPNPNGADALCEGLLSVNVDVAAAPNSEDVPKAEGANRFCENPLSVDVAAAPNSPVGPDGRGLAEVVTFAPNPPLDVEDVPNPAGPNRFCAGPLPVKVAAVP